MPQSTLSETHTGHSYSFVRIPTPIWEQVKLIAKRSRRSGTATVEIALERFLEEWEQGEGE